jgi:GT2 family glycosyltransferase
VESSSTNLRDFADTSIGVVVLNWNNGDDTVSCLSNLLECSPRPERAVVVDNGSEDDSLSRIREWKSGNASAAQDWLEVIAAGANLGFAGGSNVGIRYLLENTAVTHVLLLNNDATVGEGFFRDLKEAVAQVPGAGIIGPTILEEDDRSKVWYAGGVEIPFRALVQHTVEIPESAEPRDTEFVTGCAMLMSRSLLESAGVLAECYFPAYFEDGDYCHRALDAGYRVIYAPKPVAYHKVGSTVRAANIALPLTYHKNRLRVIYARRNYKGATKVVALLYLAVTKPVRALVDTIKGRPRHGWAVLSGAVAGFAKRKVA